MYSTDVARAWERAAAEPETPRTRKVMLRTAMVMSPDAGGVFDVHAGGQLVYRKFDTGRFPTEQEIVDKVATTLNKA